MQKWGTAEAEFSALQGAQVVEIATALKTFEDELVMYEWPTLPDRSRKRYSYKPDTSRSADP